LAVLFGFLTLKDFKIIWLLNILVLSVPDGDYSRNVLTKKKGFQNVRFNYYDVHPVAFFTLIKSSHKDFFKILQFQLYQSFCDMQNNNDCH
jgi:hypothetical protein